MTHYPQQPHLRRTPKAPAAAPKTGLLRAGMWGRPVFKAPALPNPRAAFDALPFTVTRPAPLARRRPSA